MANQEELDLIKSNLGKIRYTFDKNGHLTVSEKSQENITIIAKHFETLRDNFETFVVSANAIMYPEEFIVAISCLPNGKQYILDNIDFIMKKNNYKRDAMAVALGYIEGVEELLLADFQKRFYLFTGQTEQSENLCDDRFFPKWNLRPSYESWLVWKFLNIASKGQNAPQIFQEKKDMFLTPLYAEIMPELVSMLADKPEFHDFIRNNFDRIIQCSKEENIIGIYKTVKDICREQYEQERFTIEQIFDKAMAKIKAEKDTCSQDDYKIMTTQVATTCGRIVGQKKSKEIESIIKVVDKDAKPEICGIGGFSIALKDGGKVFKIGGDRLKHSPFEIPNHPRLLRPIIRKKDVSTLENHPIYFEIQDEVDTNIEVTDEELLEIYKELRVAGLKWCDAKKQNLGRLRADNCGYPIGDGVPSNNQSLGLKGEDSFGSSLKKGDLVIIDLDLIYPLDCIEADFTPSVPDFIREYEAKISKQEQSNETR